MQSDSENDEAFWQKNKLVSAAFVRLCVAVYRF